MGRRVAALWRAGAGMAPLRFGVRRRGRLGELAEWPDSQVVTIRMEDPACLRAAVEGTAAVINACGPFLYDPEPLLDACAAAGAHYVDLASEPGYLAGVRAWSERPDLAIALCPGASTVPGLIELAATYLAEHLRTAPSCFEIFLSMGTAHRLTTGLLGSLTLPLAAPLRSENGALAYRQFRIRTLRGLGPRLFGRYPAPFDEHGLRIGARCFPTRFWVGFDRHWIVRALRAASYLRPHFRDDAWLALVRVARPLVRIASWFGQSAGELRIEALDSTGNLLAGASLFAARDGLSVPALPPVWATRSLLAGARPGHHSLAELIPFEEAIASLRRCGFEIFMEG